MARKKLSALAIPKLSPGDWHDTIVPGLILRVGANRQPGPIATAPAARKLRLTLGYHPGMGLAEAREAARKAIERVDGGVMPAAPAPHPRSADALTLGSLARSLRGDAHREGQRIKALPKAMRRCGATSNPILALPAREFSKADLRAVRDGLIEAAP